LILEEKQQQQFELSLESFDLKEYVKPIEKTIRKLYEGIEEN